MNYRIIPNPILVLFQRMMRTWSLAEVYHDYFFWLPCRVTGNIISYQSESHRHGETPELCSTIDNNYVLQSYFVVRNIVRICQYYPGIIRNGIWFLACKLHLCLQICFNARN